MEASTSIVEWYKNQTIFITGGSGYLGKGLIFKLIQCGTPKIFLLIRTKKGQNPQDRLDAIAQSWIFDSLRAQGIDVRSKLVAISGDVTVAGLGISDEDRVTLQEEVTVVLHVAASVKFDDPLKTAVFYNLRSTRDVVELAKNMKQLKIFHHVSTAYCNIDHLQDPDGIVEKIYPAKMNWRKLIEFVETAPDEIIAALEKKLLDNHINTYLFTKQIAESVIEEASHEIPAVLSRPPIVLGTLKEPDPGWIDNISSPVALIGGAGKGVLRAYAGSEVSLKAYTPADIMVNMILVSSWNEAIIKKGDADGQLKVYNGGHVLLNDQFFHEMGFQILKKSPCHNALWHPQRLCTSNITVFLFYHILVHLLPGIFFDTLLLLSGNKPRLLKIYRKLYVAILNLHPIILLNDKFNLTNYNGLKNQIPKEEAVTFPLYVPQAKDKAIRDWYYNTTIGFRKFIGEPHAPTPADFAWQKRLYWIDVVFKICMACLLLWLAPLHFLGAPFVWVANVMINFYDSL